MKTRNKEHKVLLAEDRKSIQNFLKNTLHFINYQVTVVENGLEALRALEKEHFDIVLLDLKMEVMDGLTCIQRIQNIKSLKEQNIPIIAVTANTFDLTKKEFQQLGFTDIIHKPIDFIQLKETIKKHLTQ